VSSHDGKVPEVSLDEALRLFLAIAYPQGLPAEVEQELAAAVKARVAVDRPEWAQASAETQAGAPAAASSVPAAPEAQAQAAGASYSQIKAHVAQVAQADEIPSDPEERYFYERKQEVEARIRQRKSEEREAAERARLAGRAARATRAIAPDRAIHVPSPQRPQHAAPQRPSTGSPPRRYRNRLAPSPGSQVSARLVIARTSNPAVTMSPEPGTSPLRPREAPALSTGSMGTSAPERAPDLGMQNEISGTSRRREDADPAMRIGTDPRTGECGAERGLGFTSRTEGGRDLQVKLSADGERGPDRRRGGLDID
jgi:hypothetical protein